MIDRAAQIILALSALACLLLLFLAFWPDGSKTSSNKLENETVALKLMQQQGIGKDLASSYYRAAAEKDVDWRLLAAIGFAESDHGRSPLPGIRSGVNLAGCCSGMMQICTVNDCGNVWKTYALDGNGDGQKSPYQKADSILTAANYLSWMQEVVGSEPKKLAAAYNAGPTLVARQGIPPYPETQAYLKKIKKVYNSLEKNPWKQIS